MKIMMQCIPQDIFPGIGGSTVSHKKQLGPQQVSMAIINRVVDIDGVKG